MIIRSVRLSDLAAFKELRLESLREHPEAFGAAYEDESLMSDAAWSERLAKSIDSLSAAVFVAEEDGRLCGMTGVWVNAGAKQNHSGGIWGVYVRPQFRGQKLADRLMNEALAWCRSRKLRLVRLTVVAGNPSAIRCYAR